MEEKRENEEVGLQQAHLRFGKEDEGGEEEMNIEERNRKRNTIVSVPNHPHNALSRNLLILLPPCTSTL